MRRDPDHALCRGRVERRAATLLAATLLGVACAPPSLRHAHSLDKGDVAVELVGGLDMTASEAEVYRADSNLVVESGELPTGDVLVRVGLGAGFELGANIAGGHLKYSILDERRHADVPMSLALTGQVGARYAGAGMLLSRELGSGPVRLRPVLNVWYQYHAARLGWAWDNQGLEEQVQVVNPGAPSETTGFGETASLSSTLRVEELAVPVGVEVPIALSESWDIVPFAAYSHSIPMAVAFGDLRCADCYAGLGDLTLTRRSQMWVGVKFQPPLRRPGESVPVQPAPAEESP